MRRTDLVPSSNVLLVAIDMDALSDVWRLLLQGHEHVAGFVIETCVGDKTRQQRLRTSLLKSSQYPTNGARTRFTQCHTFAGVVVSDLANGVADYFLIVHGGTRRHFTSQQDHPGLGNSLCTKQEEHKTQYATLNEKQMQKHLGNKHFSYHMQLWHQGPVWDGHPGQHRWSDRRSYLERGEQCRWRSTQWAACTPRRLLRHQQEQLQLGGSGWRRLKQSPFQLVHVCGGPRRETKPRTGKHPINALNTYATLQPLTGGMWDSGCLGTDGGITLRISDIAARMYREQPWTFDMVLGNIS